MKAGYSGIPFPKHGQDNFITLYDTKWEDAWKNFTKEQYKNKIISKISISREFKYLCGSFQKWNSLKMNHNYQWPNRRKDLFILLIEKLLSCFYLILIDECIFAELRMFCLKCDYNLDIKGKFVYRARNPISLAE